MDLENPIAQLFRTSAVESSIALQIFEVHDDGEPTVDVRLIHTGRVLGRHVKLSGKNREAILKSEPLITAQKRPAIREKSGKTCPYVLYDPFTCKATQTPVFGTITAINGVVLTVDGAEAVAGNDLVGGYIETFEEKRMIVGHSGQTVTIHTVMQGLETGDAATMYIGCNHTTSDCERLHDNIPDFGGEPFIPSKNPHDRRIV